MSQPGPTPKRERGPLAATVPSLPVKQFAGALSTGRAPPTQSAPADRSYPSMCARNTVWKFFDPCATTGSSRAPTSATGAASLGSRISKPRATRLPVPVSPPRERSRDPRSSNPSSTPLDTLRLRNDRLGTLVSELVRSYQEAGSWEAFASAFRGRSCLSENLDNIEHPAADLPRKWRDEGVPAQSSSPPWTVEQKDECVRRGCHPSASLHASFLREEMAEFIENKFWAVLPYELVASSKICSCPPLQSRKSVTGSHDSCAITPGPGLGAASTRLRHPMLPQKPCNSEVPCRVCST